VIACVVIPFFAAAVEQQFSPSPLPPAFVVRNTARGRQKVVAVSEEAARADLRQGMYLRQAQTLLPDVRVVPLNATRYRSALDALVDRLSLFTELIDVHERGWDLPAGKTSPFWAATPAALLNAAVVFLDIGKIRFKEAGAFGKRILDAVWGLDFHPMIALAANRFTAWVAAQAARRDETPVVQRGEESWTLTCHPVGLLPLKTEQLRRLWLVGIRTIGEFAHLPASVVLAQFGNEGKKAHRMANGIDPTPVRRLKKESTVTRSYRIDEGINDKQVLGKILKEMVEAGAKEMGGAARQVRLSLTLIDGGVYEAETTLRRRTEAPARLFGALEALLEKAQITCAVCELVMTFSAIQLQAARQLELFPTDDSQNDYQVVLDDLLHRYGGCFFTTSVEFDRTLIPFDQAIFEMMAA
jgi:nucleotidyltransferase/DNA polymerase involved in DNA repair